MKKFLLSAAALVCAASVNAQVLQLNGEDFGFSSEAADCPAGTVWGSAGSVELTNPFATTHKLVDCKNNDYNQVIFNGADVILTKNGVQGQDNPKDVDGGNPGVSLIAPSSGAAIQVTAAANGYVYIVAKLSSNKNYYVFEEGSPLGFTLAMEINDERFPENKIVYEAIGDDEFNYLSDNTYTNWPVKVATGDPDAATAGNGLGVIGFEVYEGLTYIVGAGGSKISWCGAYFCEAPVSVTIKGDEKAEFTLLGEGPAPAGETEVALVENHTLLVADLEAAGATDASIVTFYIENESGESREGWGIGGFANSDNWTPIENWEGKAGDSWTYEYTLADIKKVAGTEPGQYHGVGVTINIYNGCKVAKVTVKNGGTGINNVKAEASAAVSYNLFGQKANATSGLMIKNGNKVLVK